MTPILQHELLDKLLQEYAGAIGGDMVAYRNHCLRVFSYYGWQRTPDEEEQRHVAVALVFHDLGIWTDGTIDYLEPSDRRMREWVAARAPELDVELISAMVLQHHRVRPLPGARMAVVEAFRRADWIDVMLGSLGYGVPRDFRREVMAALPNAGFHKRLLQLGGRRFLSKPWSPLPMLRW